MEANSDNILKALLLIVLKLNSLNSTMSKIEETLQQLINPKQEESN